MICLIVGVFRVLDWIFVSETSTRVASVECGFDSATTSVGNSRIVSMIVLALIFEIEILLV